MNSEHPISKRFRGFLPVVIDIETGGFNPYSDAILEIAASVISMNEEGKLISRMPISFEVEPFPNANLEQAALDFTGIDPYDPNRNSVTEQEAMAEIFSHVRAAVKSHNCTRAVLVGHNSAFDLSFINAAIERNEIKRSPFHPFTSFDTATLAGIACGQTVLAKACETSGIVFDEKNAHSALYDTEKTAELFCLISNAFPFIGKF
jgi:ribonuclease T